MTPARAGWRRGPRVSRHFTTHVYDTVIPRNVRLSEAPSFGKPVTQYDTHSAGAAAIGIWQRSFLTRQGITFEASQPTASARRIPLFRMTIIGQEG